MDRQALWLLLFDGNAVLVDGHLDTIGFLFFLIKIAAKNNNGDDECADDEIQSIGAIQNFPLA